MVRMGAAAAVAGIALAYATNYCMAGIAGSKQKNWTAPYLTPTASTMVYVTLNKIFHVAAVIVGTASLVLFIYGMFAVKNSIFQLA